MRFMITSGPGDNSKDDAKEPFDEDLFKAYMKFNEDMAKAGVLVVAEGLNPAGKGARVEVRHGKRTVVDGPFTETKELLGGFYLIEVASLDEAIAWAMRCPVGMGSADVLQIHKMTEGSDLPQALLDLAAEVAPTWTASLTKTKQGGR